MAAQHFFVKAWSLSFERFSKKIRDFVKNLIKMSLVTIVVSAHSQYGFGA
jgi:hypothetical protein